MGKNIAIIGSGITGIVSAYYLAKAGHSVTVFDKESYSAMKCSYANGGQVSVSNSEVWNTYDNVFKGLKWIFTKDAPFRIHPGLEVDKISWILKFLYHTVKNDYENNTLETIRMGLASRELYHYLIAEEKIEFDQRYSGIVHIYKNRKYYEKALKAKRLYNSMGCEWEPISLSYLRSLDYNCGTMRSLLDDGAIYTKSDFTGDIHKFCNSLEKVLKQKYNVKFKFRQNIEHLYEMSDYDCTVVSAGHESVRLAKTIGDRLSIYPVKGYSITIEGNDINLLPKVSILDDQAKIVTSTLGNRFRVAGTAELNGVNYDIVRDRIDPLLNWVKTNFPQINTRNYSPYACLRPMTPNMMPIVKQSSNDSRVFYNTGHGHLGWTLAPFTAKTLQSLVDKND